MTKEQAYKRFYELNLIIATAQKELKEVVSIIQKPEGSNSETSASKKRS